MGLLDKLLKKGPKADSVSKGGSPIYHYDEKKDKEWRPPRLTGSTGRRSPDILAPCFRTGRNLCFMRYCRIWSTLT